MKPPKGTWLRRLLLLAAVVVAGIVVHFFYAPLGYVAVRTACESSGGLKIVSRVSAQSYLNSGIDWAEGVRTNDCRHCAGQVASGMFAHIDFRPPASPTNESPKVVQYRLEPAPDPRCVEAVPFSHPPPGTCVAIVPLDGSSKEQYEFRSTLSSNRQWLGVAILERRRTLTDTTASRVVAEQRYFSYATPYERSGRFEPRYHCDRSKVDPRVESQFFEAAFVRNAKSNDVR